MVKSTDQEILRVARKHFVQHGFAGARMQDIADDAGINKAMLHYYFRSKEKLYGEIIEQILNTMIPKLAMVLQSRDGFWDKLDSLVETYINTLVEHPDIPIFVMSELSQKRERFIEALKERSQLFPAVQEFIADVIKEIQEGRIRSIPPHHLFLNIMGMTVFPFIAKPVFCTLFNYPEKEFGQMMLERKPIIIDFLKNALRVD